MIPVDDALAALSAAVRVTATEVVALDDSLARVTAADTFAAHPLPLFDQSGADGYAVRHYDLRRPPVTLPLARGAIPAGPQTAAPHLPEDAAARIFTGGLLPTGADTVVRQEVTTSDGVNVTIGESAALGADVRRAGEDLPAGALLAAAGSVVTAGLIGELALGGAYEILVRKRARVAVLVTGDEVVPVGGPVGLGQIPDANGPMVRAHLAAWGVEPPALVYVGDTEASVRSALDTALASADLVITTGGVSVGDFDFIPAVAESLGAQRLFWKVAQRPGMPLYAATRDGALLLGLPGNPGAVLVGLNVYVRRVLDLMAGLNPATRSQHGPAIADVKPASDRTLWVRCVASTNDAGAIVLSLLGGQASHLVANLAHANALARVPGANEPAPRTPGALDWLPLPD